MSPPTCATPHRPTLPDLPETGDLAGMRLTKGRARIEWTDLNEGWDGTFDPSNPDDRRLLRFDTFVQDDGAWRPCVDGSYCTALPVATSEADRQRALAMLMDVLYDGIVNNTVKKAAERASWINPAWLDRANDAPSPQAAAPRLPA